jgi:hypothetical protein
MINQQSLLVVLGLVACAYSSGESNGVDNGGAGGTSGAAGAGSAAGGSSGASGSGGTTGAICSPGTTVDGTVAYYDGHLKNCNSYDPAVVGGGVGNAPFITDIALAAPIGPGDTYAFSVDMESSVGGTMEFWGSNAECGPGLELLATSPMGVGMRCVELAPTQGPYTHIIWAWYGGGAHYDVTFCPGGTCG